ncbi:MAG: hypothetical protein BWY69_00314 [Planctomycetes bacterium ADurb.Bin401]|nr:MAG: hypothetical protein BWY69_00314 [Planctomycetes bacterium ADurb.Bin401]
MPLQKRKIDYLMFKIRGNIVKVDPDIYCKIFNIHREPPNRKYRGPIKHLAISPNGNPLIVIGEKVRHYIPISRFIMNAQKGQIVDHINRDPFDNRRCNLRFVTKRQNTLNKTCYNETGFFGVNIIRSKNRSYCFGKFLWTRGKDFRIQLPDNPANRVVCAFARDKFVLQAGDEEYAPLNFPCFKYEPFRSILLNEDLKKYKTKRYANCQLEFPFMKFYKKYI